MDGEDKNSSFSLVFSPRRCCYDNVAQELRRKNYVHDSLTEWNGVKLVDIDCPKKKSLEAVVHTFRAVNQAKRLGADLVHIHAIGPALMVPYAKLLGMRVVFTHHGPDYDRDKWGASGEDGAEAGRALRVQVCGRCDRDFRCDQEADRAEVRTDAACASDL